MRPTEVKIVLAASDVIARNGARQTSMQDIAAAAQVSRQTLYAHFDSKSDLLLAVFQHGTDTILTELSASWDGADTVAQVLDAYFDAAILAPFELFQKHPELSDFLEGSSGPQTELVDTAKARLAGALAERLTPFEPALTRTGYDAAELATYVVQVSKALKLSSPDRITLERQLHLLKTGVLAMMDAA